MKMFAQIVRYVLALILLVFGSNKFIGFIPSPEFAEGSAPYLYFQGLGASGYFFPLLALTEISSGLMLALNKWVPLALIISAPVALNIALFHVSMDPAGGAVGYIIFLGTAFLIYTNQEKYQSLIS